MSVSEFFCILPRLKPVSDGWHDIFLFAGPHIVLCCYEDATTVHFPTEFLDDEDDHSPSSKFIQKALDEIIEERHVTEPTGIVGVILDDINGEHDRCMSRCFLQIPF